MKRNSLAVRLVAAAVLWIGGALLAGGLLMSSLFRGYAERTFDARLDVHLTSLISVTDVGSDGALVLSRKLGEPRFEKPFSGWYWQIRNAAGPVLRSRSLWDQVLPLDTNVLGAIARSWSKGPSGKKMRVFMRQITLPGAPGAYQVTVAAETSEIAREIRKFDLALFWSLAALGLGLIVAIYIQVKFGLNPMKRLRAGLASVRAGKSIHLDGDFPVEVTPLVEDLNALLDHNKVMVDRARTHVGNLAHALKTPLSVLASEAGSDKGPSRDVLKHEVESIRRQVDHHLARAHTAASGRTLGVRTPVVPAVQALKRALDRIYAGRSIAISIDAVDAAVFRGQRQDLDEVLGNLMENGCKWARSRVSVTVTLEDERTVLTIDDDGRGLDPVRRTQVLERGMRLDETAPGSGLGLAIVRDIVTAYGGKFHLDESPLGGLRATVALPAAVEEVERSRVRRRPARSPAG